MYHEAPDGRKPPLATGSPDANVEAPSVADVHAIMSAMGLNGIPGGDPAGAPANSALSSDVLAQESAGGGVASVSLKNPVRVPTQFDEFKMADSGNQCAFCAHQFALRSEALLSALKCGSGLADVYRACLQKGTAMRQTSCDSGGALPVGENIDDPVVLQSVTRTIHDDPSTKDPNLCPPRIIRAAPGSIFHQQRPLVPMMFPDPDLASRIMAASDEARHPEATRADLESVLSCLPEGGVVVLERHIEAMALIRTCSDDPLEMFLVCDSHATRCGLVSFEDAVKYVFGLIPRADFPLIFMHSPMT